MNSHRTLCTTSGAPSERALSFLLMLLMSLPTGPILANPKGMTVSRGVVSATQNGSKLTIRASHNAVINWQQFNIGEGETTTFKQPSRVSVVWNRIFDADPSQIWGRMNANGYVVLMNQNGFYFGPNSEIHVGGMVVTTVPVAPESPVGGGIWQFNGAPPLASIVNYGEVKAESGGSVFLISEKVENHGTISAEGGKVGLYAGKEVLMSERPDGRGLSASVRLPAGSVDNSGKIVADAGAIALHARVVNQGGIVQANSVRHRNGVIEFAASESVNLDSTSLVQAKGDSEGVSPGGKVVVRSAGSFADAAGSQIDVRGGEQGGHGGFAEISAPRMAAVNSKIDGTAASGWKGGRLFLDPMDIFLGNSGTDTPGPGGTVNPSDPPTTAALRLNVNSAFLGLAQIHLQATRDIFLQPQTIWNLSASTGISDPGSMLTLEAGRNINFGPGSKLIGGPGWSVQLAAGADFSSPLHVVSGVGGIYLNGSPVSGGARPSGTGNGSLEAFDGSLTLVAGKEVVVGSGYVRTTGGGNISVNAGTGDVDAGVRSQFYEFTRLGYSVSLISGRELGGITTSDGGDVNITAGRDILSFVPTTGAYGEKAGNVTLTAGGRVMGKYMLRNGTGLISAGTAAGDGVGTFSSPVSLGLVHGSWNVVKARDIYLNEVFNPNGSLNPNGTRLTSSQATPFEFDYALDASVRLMAQNAVQLLGSGLASVPGQNNGRPVIYAPKLEIHAGAGGVTLGNDVILFPSPQGRLQITTTDGGSMRSTLDGDGTSKFFQLVMSDSGSRDYQDFAQGHARRPLHLASAADPMNEPVHIMLDGNLENIFMRMPKKTDVDVKGNVLNFSFEGQHLRAGDESHIRIGGDYFSRSDRTFVTLRGTPNLDVLDPLRTINPNLAARITYDPATRRLGIQGRMTQADVDFLLKKQDVIVLDARGLPLLDAHGNIVYTKLTFTSDSAAITKLKNQSKEVPASALAYKGIQIGGPGTLSLTARNMNLGTSQGIRSVGTLLNPGLAAITYAGAKLVIDLVHDETIPNSGNLDMTSSQIASFNGGSITVKAGGHADIGSQTQFTSDDTPKGIYTGHGGDVTLIAEGDISLNGSRVATYDGGDVIVTSTKGSVNAGAGGKGFFTVTTQQEDPETRKPVIRNDKFFGSGIVALTRVDSSERVGDITVTAGKDILANAGGILQQAFNNSDISDVSVSLDAKRDIVAGQSGVLGANVKLKAGRDIKGLIVANNNLDIKAQQNVNVVALAAGNASVSGGGTVSGSIVAQGNVNVAGDSVSAAVISTGGSASTSGDSGAAKVGAFANVAAPTAQQTTQDAAKTVATKTEEEDEEEKKKRAAAKGPTLAKTVGRVTVILPEKK